MLESQTGGLTDMKIANNKTTSLKRFYNNACIVILCFALCIACVASSLFFSFDSSNVAKAEELHKKHLIANPKRHAYKHVNPLSKGLSLKITDSTAIVTDKSGYHLSISINTAKNQTLPEGTISVFVNPYYTFTSRTDIQKWAEGESHIPTRQLLGKSQVDTMAAKSSRIVNVDVPSDSPNLATIKQWGPKPLLVLYTSTDESHIISVQTFLTRSNDGLSNTNTPPIGMTAIMPILANPDSWKTTIDTQQSDEIVNNNHPNNAQNNPKNSSKTNSQHSGENSNDHEKTGDSAAQANNSNNSNNSNNTNNTKKLNKKNTLKKEKIISFPYNIRAKVSLNNNELNRITKQVDLAEKHNLLQTIADPYTLKAARILYRPSAFMQKAGFDISSYADDSNFELYKSAGITPNEWSLKETCSIYSSLEPSQKLSQNDSECVNGKTPVFAWQTNGKWTLNALVQAKNSGYNTVIATHGFDPNANRFATNTGVYNIQTNSGEINVLASQNVLTHLANGQASSDYASAESTEAGRISRLVAQSAFYQMEQPYASRNLLITFATNTSAKSIDNVMNALEKSPWIDLKNLQSLTSSEPFNNENSRKVIPLNSGLSSESAKSRNDKLRELAKSRENLISFTNDILDNNAIQKEKSDAGDAQSLAKQHAKMGALSKTSNSKIWSKKLIDIFDSMAFKEILHYDGKPYFDAKTHSSSFGSIANQSNEEKTNSTQANEEKTNTEKTNEPKSNASQSKNKKPQQPTNNASATQKFTTQTLVNSLLSGIRIVPPPHITVFSETASLPVTISNAHPYPIRVYLTATTKSMEIVLGRTQIVSIPADSEIQVTLPVRVTTSAQVKALFRLEDRQHHTFSTTNSTTITSTLQISDKSGTIIIIFAFALGIWGLYRQFHRKKDPDE